MAARTARQEVFPAVHRRTDRKQALGNMWAQLAPALPPGRRVCFRVAGGGAGAGGGGRASPPPRPDTACMDEGTARRIYPPPACLARVLPPSFSRRRPHHPPATPHPHRPPPTLPLPAPRGETRQPLGGGGTAGPSETSLPADQVTERNCQALESPVVLCLWWWSNKTGSGKTDRGEQHGELVVRRGDEESVYWTDRGKKKKPNPNSKI